MQKMKWSKRKKFVLLAMILCVFGLPGCKVTQMRLMPEWDRNGEYFYLTRRYPETQFHLWGACLTESDGKISLLPPPSAIFPGLPLLLLEKCVICPLMDVLWLPADFARNCYLQSDGSVKGNGYYIQVMDVWGRPVKGVMVVCDAIGTGYCNIKTPVLKGRRHQGGCVGQTDENGELYVPYDCTTVDRLDVRAFACSVQGEFASTYYDSPYRHPPYVRKPTDYRRAVYEGSVDPNEVFPKRDTNRTIRIVMEPELEWPDGRHAKWKFIPKKECEMRRSNAKAAFYGNRANIDDL